MTKETVDKIVKKIKQLPELQEDELYVMIAIARTKYNPAIGHDDNDHKSTAVFRKPVRDDNIRSVTQRVVGMVKNFSDDVIRPEDFNIYLSFNPRSIPKAMNLFQKRLSDWTLRDELYDRARSLDSYWVSCLQKPEARSRKNFYMLDVDDPDDVLAATRMFDHTWKEHRTEEPPTVKHFESRNGVHLLCKPFDTHYYKQFAEESGVDVEVKTDSLVNLWCGSWGFD